MDVADFITAAAGAAFLANLIVAGIKRGWPTLPSGGTVALAFIAALGGQFLLLLTKDTVFTRSVVATAVVIGLVAWGLSIGVVEVLRKADRVDEKIDVALDMKPGSTRADVEAAVNK